MPVRYGMDGTVPYRPLIDTGPDTGSADLDLSSLLCRAMLHRPSLSLSLPCSPSPHPLCCVSKGVYRTAPQTDHPGPQY